MGERAASALANYAEAVRVIDDEPGVVAFGQRQQLRQRREVAVHAEHGVGHDQFAPRLAAGEQALQRIGIVVRVAVMLGARQQCSVDQRGVVQAVGEDRVTTTGQRRQQAEVGHHAGAEKERPFGADEGRQPLL